MASSLMVEKYSACVFPRVTVLMMLAIVSSGAVIAQKSSDDKTKSLNTKKVSVQTKLSQDKVHAGSTVFALLIVTIQDDWHINSSTPSEENLIGTSVEVSKVNAIDSVAIRFPKGIEKTFDFADTPLEVYEGTFEILIKLVMTADVNPGTYAMSAILGYQACNNSVCLAPAAVKVDLPLHVVPMNEPTPLVNRELFETYQEVFK